MSNPDKSENIADIGADMYFGLVPAQASNDPPGPGQLTVTLALPISIAIEVKHQDDLTATRPAPIPRSPPDAPRLTATFVPKSKEGPKEDKPPQQQHVRIARPPASRLVATLRYILTEHAFERMVAPYIAQEQHEYYETLLRNDRRRARWIVLRMYLLIWYNVLCALTTSINRLIRRSG